MTTDEKLAALGELSGFPHDLHVVDFEPGKYDGTDIETAGVDEANVISSRVTLPGHVGMHTVAIDIDVPARLVPSTTPGHSHLYIDALMPWETYRDLLRALAEAGVIEPGYLRASERRGHTTLRLPWVKKGQAA